MTSFRVERPDQLWHLDMTSVWVAEHGWCYLMAAIDCCTREITAWGLELRCRAEEAIALIEDAGRAQGSSPGSWCWAPITARHSPRGASRRCYRDSASPTAAAATATESQAFIESWFGKLKKREVWRNEYETLEDARAGIGAYVERYHERPHSGLGYRTPKEVRQTWEDAQDENEALRKEAA